ncbi:hypothetical protein HBB16_06230 [Pseudonocardia sp. MCCB 268]|nr:hypothetical protein [Pseudonocardia cytotoxica]
MAKRIAIRAPDRIDRDVGQLGVGEEVERRVFRTWRSPAGLRAQVGDAALGLADQPGRQRGPRRSSRTRPRSLRVRRMRSPTAGPAPVASSAMTTLLGERRSVWMNTGSVGAMYCRVNGRHEGAMRS